jgi:hypothetical protein
MSTSPEGGPPERCAKRENVFITHIRSVPSSSSILNLEPLATEEGASDTEDGAQDILGHDISLMMLHEYHMRRDFGAPPPPRGLGILFPHSIHCQSLATPPIGSCPSSRRRRLRQQKEEPIDSSDFQGRRVPFLSARGHLCSLITLAWQQRPQM